jgi:hypothetical protein
MGVCEGYSAYASHPAVGCAGRPHLSARLQAVGPSRQGDRRWRGISIGGENWHAIQRTPIVRQPTSAETEATFIV